MCPTDRGNDPTVDSDETERVDRERGTESSNRDGNGPLHYNQWTLVQNPRRAWKKGNGLIKDGLVWCKSEKLTIVFNLANNNNNNNNNNDQQADVHPGRQYTVVHLKRREGTSYCCYTRD
jgi:hypothetical protein